MIRKIIFSFLFFTVCILSQDENLLFKDAMQSFNSEQYSESILLFEKFLTEYRISDEVYATAKYYYAEALLKLGKLDPAAEGFEYLIKNFTWSAYRDRALYKAGLIYFDQEKYSLSRGKLKQLLNEYPESENTGGSLYWVGESYTKQNNLEEAINFLLEAVEDKRKNKFIDHSLYALASVYEKIEDYESAVKYYDQLLSYYKDSPLASSARIRIGICYFKLKDYHTSILELNNPLLSDLSPDLYSESLYLLANSYYRVEEYANAEKTYKEIVQQYPGYQSIREVRYGLGWAYFQQKKYNDAYLIFNSLSDGTDSLAVKSFYWKGEAKRYAGQESEAFNIYRDFVARFPTNSLAASVQYQMGVIYFNTKRYDLADKYLNSATFSPDYSIRSRALTLLGELSLEKKQYTAANNYFNDAMNIKDVPEELQNRSLLGLGVSSFFLNKPKDALASLGELELRAPNFESEKVNFYLGESYFYAGNFEQSLSHYNKVVTNNPIVASLALYGKAYALYNLQKFDIAADAFVDFIKKYNKESRIVDAKLRLADCYYGTKNYKAASTVYKELFNSKGVPDNPYAYYQYAQALFKGGNTTDAIKEFSNLQSKYPDSEYADKSLFIIGWISFQQNKYSEAIQYYKDVLGVYPRTSLRPVIYYSIADAYYNMAKYDSAIVNYQKVLLEYPASQSVFDAINGIQYSYIAQSKPEKAITLISDFINSNPQVSFADQLSFKKGEIYYSIREYDKAKSSYKEFLSAYPKSNLKSEAYYWIGKSAQILGENEEAIRYFTTVFNDFPSKESAGASVIEIANIYNKEKKYDAALQILNRATTKLTNSPRLPELLFIKGETYGLKGDISSSYDVYGQILQGYTGNIFSEKAKLEMGLIDLAARRYDNADLFFKNLSENRNDEIGARAQFYYGLSLFEQDKMSEAISALVRVRTVFSAYDEWVARSFLKLGDIYIEQKDYSKAREMFQAVVAKHKGNVFGQEAQTKLRTLK